MGIRSSWNGTRSLYRKGADQQQPVLDEAEDLGRPSSRGSDDGRGKMVDIGLESTVADDEPPPDLTVETPVDTDPPAFQKFKSPGGPGRFKARRDSANDSELGLVRDSSADTTLQAAASQESDGELFRHDPFFAWLYLIALAAMLATFVLIFLNTSAPSGKKPWGDTIYTTLLASFHLLAVDTLVAVIVSLIWLAALRSFVKYLVALMILAVPVILLSFSLYPLISSYQGGGASSPVQDEVMRWSSIIPGAAAFVWLYLLWKGRHALGSSIEILEFSSRILAANSALVLVGMACLALVVLWTWAWLAMFTRIFLGGHFSSRTSLFIINPSSWWLGAYFVLMYLWTLSVIAGVQRATTGATVSQWYFHRNAQPAPSSRDVVAAALNHALTTIFGTISLSTLLALAIRLPLLLLPQRFGRIISVCFYSLIPPNMAALTNPLTLTYAAIHSQNLTTSARGPRPDGLPVAAGADDDADAPRLRQPARQLRAAAAVPAGEAAAARHALHHGHGAGVRGMGHDGATAAHHGAERRRRRRRRLHGERIRICRGPGGRLHRLGRAGGHGGRAERHRRRRSHLLRQRDEDGPRRRRLLHGGSLPLRRPERRGRAPGLYRVAIASPSLHVRSRVS